MSEYVATGDVDGDGRDDLAIHNVVSEGPCTVYWLTTMLQGELGPEDAEGVLLSTNPPAGCMGYNLASGGDIDADGRDELLVEDVFYPTTEPADDNHGLVVVVPGGTRGTLSYTDLPMHIQSTEQVLHLGASMAFVGDTNGDGFDDVLLGGHTRRDPETEGSTGAAYLFLGGGL